MKVIIKDYVFLLIISDNIEDEKPQVEQYILFDSIYVLLKSRKKIINGDKNQECEYFWLSKGQEGASQSF